MEADEEDPRGVAEATVMDQAADPDGHVRLSLGLYVLGALDETDRATVEEHLALCRQCQSEHDYIAVIPSLLQTLTHEEISQLQQDPDDQGFINP